MSEIVAHRGFWLHPEEKNSREAFERAFLNGYGVETDVRDLRGELVIAHDMPLGGEMTLASFLELYRSTEANTTLAINIKSDGLAASLQGMLQEYGVSDYFVFDMSVPDSLSYLKAGMPVFARLSEYEPWSRLCDDTSGIWLDGFEADPEERQMSECLAAGKSLCVVSPELHGRNHQAFWSVYKRLRSQAAPARLFICTDYPKHAEEFFSDN